MKNTRKNGKIYYIMRTFCACVSTSVPVKLVWAWRNLSEWVSECVGFNVPLDTSAQADGQYSATVQPGHGAGLVQSAIMAAGRAFSHGTARKSNKK